MSASPPRALVAAPRLAGAWTTLPVLETFKPSNRPEARTLEVQAVSAGVRRSLRSACVVRRRDGVTTVELPLDTLQDLLARAGGDRI